MKRTTMPWSLVSFGQVLLTNNFAPNSDSFLGFVQFNLACSKNVFTLYKSMLSLNSFDGPKSSATPVRSSVPDDSDLTRILIFDENYFHQLKKLSHSALRIYFRTVILGRYSAWYVLQHVSRCPRETCNRKGRRKEFYDYSMFGGKICQ